MKISTTYFHLSNNFISQFQFWVRKMAKIISVSGSPNDSYSHLMNGIYFYFSHTYKHTNIQAKKIARQGDRNEKVNRYENWIVCSFTACDTNMSIHLILLFIIINIFDVHCFAALFSIHFIRFPFSIFREKPKKELNSIWVVYVTNHIQ